MKNILFLFSLFFIIVACSGTSDSCLNKGLLAFEGTPVYFNENIEFQVLLQLPEKRKSINVEYKILMDSNLISSGKAAASMDNDASNRIYETALICIPLSKSEYSGKTLTILLDPELKISMLPYSSDYSLYSHSVDINIPK